MCRGGGGEYPKRGARREGEIPGDLTRGGRDHGGRKPWDTCPFAEFLNLHCYFSMKDRFTFSFSFQFNYISTSIHILYSSKSKNVFSCWFCGRKFEETLFFELPDTAR